MSRLLDAFRDPAIVVIASLDSHEAMRPIKPWEAVQATHPVNPKRAAKKPRPHKKGRRK